METKKFAAWNTSKRAQIRSFLEVEGIDDPQIGDWPAFEVAPHFGIWCVESKKQSGKIGWWAFAGDCPTAYVAEDGQCHPRAALRNLLRRWRDHIPHMKKRLQPPDVKFGDGSLDLRELADLLETRVSILQEWLENDALWENR